MARKHTLWGIKAGYESLKPIGTMKVPKTKTPYSIAMWLAFCAQNYCQSLVSSASTMLQDARSWGDVEEYCVIVGYKTAKDLYEMLNLAVKIGTDMIKRMLTGTIRWANPKTTWTADSPDPKKEKLMNNRYQPKNQLNWIMGQIAQISTYLGVLYDIKIEDRQGNMKFWGPMSPVARWNKAAWVRPPDIIESDMSNWDDSWPIERKKMALLPCYRGTVPTIARIAMPRIQQAWDAQELVSRPTSAFQAWVDPTGLPIALGKQAAKYYATRVGPEMDNANSREPDYESGVDDQSEIWQKTMQEAFDEIAMLNDVSRLSLAKALWWAAHSTEGSNATAPFIMCPDECVQIITEARLKAEKGETVVVTGIGFRHQWEDVPESVEDMPVEVMDEIITNKDENGSVLKTGRKMLIRPKVTPINLHTNKYPEGILGEIVKSKSTKDAVMPGMYIASFKLKTPASWEVTLSKDRS